MSESDGGCYGRVGGGRHRKKTGRHRKGNRQNVSKKIGVERSPSCNAIHPFSFRQMLIKGELDDDDLTLLTIET